MRVLDRTFKVRLLPSVQVEKETAFRRVANYGEGPEGAGEFLLL